MEPTGAPGQREPISRAGGSSIPHLPLYVMVAGETLSLSTNPITRIHPRFPVLSPVLRVLPALSHAILSTSRQARCHVLTGAQALIRTPSSRILPKVAGKAVVSKGHLMKNNVGSDGQFLEPGTSRHRLAEGVDGVRRDASGPYLTV